jgi:hypothetical protein
MLQHCCISGLHHSLNSKMKTMFRELALLPSSGPTVLGPVEGASLNPGPSEEVICS